MSPLRRRAAAAMPSFGAAEPITHTVRGPDGAEIAVFEYPAAPGDGAAPVAGEVTVVLAHGWTNDHRVWEPVVARLQGRHAVRVLAYDHPGHGRSGQPAARRPAVRELAGALRAVIDAHAGAGDLVLAGHSMGGMTLMALAGTDPELVRTRVRGVALVSTAAQIGPDRRPVPGERVVMGLSALLPARVSALPLPTAMVRASVFGRDPDPQGVRAAVAQTHATSARATGRYFRALAEHDEFASLAGFAGVRTLVITGAMDRLTPVKWARRLAAGIPGATFWMLPGCGHMLTYEAPDFVTDRLAELLEPAPLATR